MEAFVPTIIDGCRITDADYRNLVKNENLSEIHVKILHRKAIKTYSLQQNQIINLSLEDSENLKSGHIGTNLRGSFADKNYMAITIRKPSPSAVLYALAIYDKNQNRFLLYDPTEMVQPGQNSYCGLDFRAAAAAIQSINHISKPSSASIKCPRFTDPIDQVFCFLKNLHKINVAIIENGELPLSIEYDIHQIEHMRNGYLTYIENRINEENDEIVDWPAMKQTLLGDQSSSELQIDNSSGENAFDLMQLYFDLENKALNIKARVTKMAKNISLEWLGKQWMGLQLIFDPSNFDPEKDEVEFHCGSRRMNGERCKTYVQFAINKEFIQELDESGSAQYEGVGYMMKGYNQTHLHNDCTCGSLYTSYINYIKIKLKWLGDAQGEDLWMLAHCVMFVAGTLPSQNEISYGGGHFFSGKRPKMRSTTCCQLSISLDPVHLSHEEYRSFSIASKDVYDRFINSCNVNHEYQTVRYNAIETIVPEILQQAKKLKNIEDQIKRITPVSYERFKANYMTMYKKRLNELEANHLKLVVYPRQDGSKILNDWKENKFPKLIQTHGELFEFEEETNSKFSGDESISDNVTFNDDFEVSDHNINQGQKIIFAKFSRLLDKSDFQPKMQDLMNSEFKSYAEKIVFQLNSLAKSFKDESMHFYTKVAAGTREDSNESIMFDANGMAVSNMKYNDLCCPSIIYRANYVLILFELLLIMLKYKKPTTQRKLYYWLRVFFLFGLDYRRFCRIIVLIFNSIGWNIDQHELPIMAVPQSRIFGPVTIIQHEPHKVYTFDDCTDMGGCLEWAHKNLNSCTVDANVECVLCIEHIASFQDVNAYLTTVPETAKKNSRNRSSWCCRFPNKKIFEVHRKKIQCPYNHYGRLGSRGYCKCKIDTFGKQTSA